MKAKTITTIIITAAITALANVCAFSYIQKANESIVQNPTPIEEELSMFLSDGTEIYATKSKSVYKPEHKNYIPFNEISGMSKADDGTITITSTDGNTYTVNTEKGE